MTRSSPRAHQDNGHREDTAINALSFDELLAKLEEIVQQLESDELSLDASIDTFAQGVGLAARCQQLLSDAELRISQITDELGESASFASLDGSDDDEEL